MYYQICNDYKELFIQGDLCYIRIQKKFPMYINNEAFNILLLCRGDIEDVDIAKILANKYKCCAEEALKMIQNFLEHCAKNKIVICSATKFTDIINLSIFGSDKYWTPQHIVIELTYNCSLFCEHCYADAGYGSFMCEDFLNKLIEEIVDLQVTTVQLTGGEPTLHPSFERIVKELTNNGIIVTITSNGYFDSKIDKSFLPIVGTSGYIQISIDGLQDSHNKIRGKNDAYEKTLSTVKRLVKMGLDVKVTTCLINQNFSEIEKLISKLKAIGIKWYSVAGLDIQGRAKSNNLLVKYDSITFKNMISKLRNLYEDDSFKILQEEFCEYDKDALFKNCGAGYNMLKISPIGEINPCILSREKLGKINLEYNLKRFLNDRLSTMNSLSKMIAPCKDLCGNCKSLEYCMNCIAKAKNSDCKIYKL